MSGGSGNTEKWQDVITFIQHLVLRLTGRLPLNHHS